MIDKINLLKQNIIKIIKGKDQEIDTIITIFLAGGHILIEDVPGVGKTTLSKALALSINCSFKRIQFTPDLLPADILGGSVYNAKEGTFDFRKGPIFGNIILADEINRASPRTQSSLLESMSEQQVTIEGETHQLMSPFIVIATQNPVDFHGTYPLPEAQMDRFSASISLGYPNAKNEMEMLYAQKGDHPVKQIQPIMNSEDINSIKENINQIHVDQNIAKYIINIINTTRSHVDIDLGLSPRAGLAMFRCAQSAAFMNERDHVIPDDIKSLAPTVFAHRLILKNKRDKTISIKKELVNSILDEIKVPV
ncbi:MAG: magnesium chelatase [Planctomycetota bacterium]|nr:MAG: magnesium chelatase [Planctomycetota bacterium]